MVIYLDDTHAGEMPFGAEMLFTNGTFNGKSVPIIPSRNLQTPPVKVASGKTALFYWLSWTNAWSTNGALVSGPLDPPANFRQNY